MAFANRIISWHGHARGAADPRETVDMRFASAFGHLGLLFAVLGVLIELIATDANWSGGWIIAIAAWAVGLYFIIAEYYELRRSD